MEWRLQDTDFPSTFEFHEHRERANHLAHHDHNQRLRRAARIIWELNPVSVVDLGCGDGGLLKLLNGFPSWGYDFTPANVEAATNERQVDVQLIDVFNSRMVPRWGQLAVMTEVLEHLAHPRDILEWVSEHVDFVLVSSPRNERGDSDLGTDPCHIWAWDWEGYENLLSEHFNVMRHEAVEWSQIILASTKRTN